MINKYLIYFVMFMSFFFGLFETAGAPAFFKLFTELAIILLLFFNLMVKKNKGIPVPNLFYMIILFGIITLFSIILNNTTLTRAVYSLRFLFRFLVFYWAIILCGYDENVLKKMNFTVLILLVCQLPIVVYKFFIYGISEKTMGGYAVHEGSIATMLPIVLIFFLAGFFFFYRPSKFFIMIAFGFVFFSIVAEKRAILFLYPIQFFAIFYFIYVKGTSAALTKKMAAFVLSLLIVTTVGATILYFNETLNPDKKAGGRIDLEYALEYASKYNKGVDGYGRSFGRIATAQRTIEILTDKGLGRFVFGIGPGSTIGSSLDSLKESVRFQEKKDDLQIQYGVTTMAFIALEYGVAGVLAFFSMLLIFARSCLKWHKVEFDPYWKAFAAGSIAFSLSMIFFAFGYNQSAFLGHIMPTIFFYAMAVAHSRYGQIKKLSKNSVLINCHIANPTSAHI